MGFTDLIDLRHFSEDEFRDSWPHMSLRLLILMDSLRHQWAAPITISPVTGALGRHNGASDPTQHNIDRWGEVRAADVFLAGMDCRNTANRAVGLAMRTGFTGIGAYPQWRWNKMGPKTAGLHLDVRTSQPPGEPSLWGGIDDGGKQVYVSLDEALSYFPE